MCNCVTPFGTEEMAHLEMLAALAFKLVDGACCEDFQTAGRDGQWAQHGRGLFWTDAAGVPRSAKDIACLGDPITDLTEDMAAEQKTIATYPRDAERCAGVDEPEQACVDGTPDGEEGIGRNRETAACGRCFCIWAMEHIATAQGVVQGGRVAA